MDLRALIFMPALVGAVVFCFVFLLFACNYYLTVLESTGAGAKEVTWVSEPLLDNAWKLAYLGWLVGLWFGPAYLIGRAATGNSAPWLTFAIPLAVLWLCFPIGQLSSLSATSIWMPLNPDMFARLVQKPGVVLVFYALSAVNLAVFGIAFHWTFVVQGQWSLLFVGAPLLVISGLVYARLLGRLAFALRFTSGLFPTKKKKKRKPDAEADRPTEPGPAVAQPSELPPLDSPEGELVGYNILIADDPPAASRKRVRAEAVEAEPPPQPAESAPAPPSLPSRRTWEDEEDAEPTAYGVKEAEVVPVDATPEEIVVPKASEMALLNRDDAPKKPKRVWSPELLAFLAQPGTVSAIIIASGFCFAVGVMIRVARDFNPAAGTG